jgi:hypothetical protein
VRHRWQITGEREVPWQALPVHVRTFQRCGLLKVREPDPRGPFFRTTYESPDGATWFYTAPACPGEGRGDESDR